MSEIKIDKLTGVGTAGSIVVTGEGTAGAGEVLALYGWNRNCCYIWKPKRSVDSRLWHWKLRAHIYQSIQ